MKLQIVPVFKQVFSCLYVKGHLAEDVAMTTILEAGMHSANMASHSASEVAETTIKKEPNYDTVRQTLREAIR